MSELSPPLFMEGMGEDTSLIEYNLSLSPDQRIMEHQSALDMVFLFEEAGKKYYEKSQLSSRDSSQEQY